jgi:branched-chain amino acid transport system ATP-binding protein
MSDILEIDGICAAYGRIQALANVSLKMPAGSIVALLGGNGAGKTTTLNTISRIMWSRPASRRCRRGAKCSAT